MNSNQCSLFFSLNGSTLLVKLKRFPSICKRRSFCIATEQSIICHSFRCKFLVKSRKIWKHQSVKNLDEPGFFAATASSFEKRKIPKPQEFYAMLERCFAFSILTNTDSIENERIEKLHNKQTKKWMKKLGLCCDFNLVVVLVVFFFLALLIACVWLVTT